MYDYLTGKIVTLTPTYLVLDNQGIGFLINITLQTYSKVQPETVEKLFIHQQIREDAHLLFGFKEEKEREVFRLLLSVSGIGANTARMILSTLSSDELIQAIASENVALLQNVKGIGAKSSQRLVVELKDKISKLLPQNLPIANNTFADEALSALVMLGFPKQQAEKALRDIVREHPQFSVEELVKMALKVL
ncbi:MAG: Holliday junction branch migration protein RuvA [Bacteroidales bacterium]|nr:Holliday junction branch migration protein RuvA [Bacteroidales bacterium]